MAFLQRYLEDWASGKALELDQYQALFSGFEELIAAEFVRVRRLHSASDEPDREPDSETAHIGPYSIVREIARGGQGIVYEAFDSALKRRVALKVLQLGLLFGDTALRRFRREAEVTSRLDHPAICPVHATGTDRGVAWIAMRYVEGETLARWIRRVREAATTTRSSRRDRSARLDETLQWGEKVLRALHTAHEAGVVHRDLKPGNIMITPDREPVILDFGLARDEWEESGLQTLTSERLGTPAYMSPEQVRGDKVDARTDIYAVGATLYEALTLQRPFSAATREQLYPQILHAIAEDPRRHEPALPRDLVAVLETAMAKERRRRYQTAADFAEDLLRVRERQPVRVRRAGPLVRTGLWTRRNPIVASLAATVLAVLVGGLWMTLSLLLQLREEQSETQSALRQMRALATASAATRQTEEYPLLGLLLALEAVESKVLPETLSAVYGALTELHVLREYHCQSSGISAFAVLPDHRHFLAGYEDSTVRLWSVADGKATLLRGHAAEIIAVAVSPEGDRLASADIDGVIRLWDAAGRPAGVLDGHAGTVNSIAFAADGATLISGGEDGTVRGWDGKQLAVLDQHDRPVVLVVLAPDDRHMVSVTQDGRVRLIAAAGGLVRSWRGAPGPSPPLACFFCDGRRVVTATDLARSSRTVRIGLRIDDLEQGTHRIVARYPNRLTSLQISREGRHLMVADAGGNNYLHDLVTQKRVPLPGHGKPISAAAFLGEQELLTGSADQTVRVWNSTGRLLQVLRGHRCMVDFVHFLDGGKRILTGGLGGSAMLWARQSPCELDLAPYRDWVGRAFYGPRPREVAVVCKDGVRVFEREHPTDAVLLPTPDFMAARVRFASDGRHVLVTQTDGKAVLWDRNGRQRAVLRWAINVPHTPFAPGGRQVLLPEGKNWRLWDLDGKLLTSLEHDSRVSAAAFSPDGELIATGEASGRVLLWTVDGRRLRVLQGHERLVTEVCFDQSGERLLTSSLDGTARVWSRSGELLAELEGHQGPIWAASLAPDGSRVLTGGADLTARIWDLQGRQIRILRGHSGAVLVARFSPDGRHIVTSATNGSTILWSRAGERVATLPVFEQPISHVEFSPDGSELMGSGIATRVCVWPVDPTELLRLARRHRLRDFAGDERQRFAKLLAPPVATRGATTRGSR